MGYDEVVRLLGYAGDHDQQVRIVLADATEVIGVPSSLDTHIAAHEVYLRPLGTEETEIAISLGEIQRVDLL